MIIPERVREVAREVHDDGETPTASVRTLLSWFDAKRRGYHVAQAIAKALSDLGIRTDPDFRKVYIDSEVRFVSDRSATTVDAEPPEEPVEAATTLPQAIEYVSGAVDDPTFRIGQLESANTPPSWVVPDASLEAASTLMMIHDYSQLPVMQNERDVKGVVSWESIGRSRALGRPCETVRDCMDTTVPESVADASLFSAIELIVRHGYLLVRRSDRVISGIVTTSDLSLQFRQLAEPFLLVGEIENYIRRLIDGKFTLEQLGAVRDPEDQREITSVGDLTFGEYLRLLEQPDNWTVLGIPIDRGILTRRLDRIRELRNDIMHFDPDPFEEEDLRFLRSFAAFMRNLVPRTS